MSVGWGSKSCALAYHISVRYITVTPYFKYQLKIFTVTCSDDYYFYNKSAGHTCAGYRRARFVSNSLLSSYKLQVRETNIEIHCGKTSPVFCFLSRTIT